MATKLFSVILLVSLLLTFMNRELETKEKVIAAKNEQIEGLEKQIQFTKRVLFSIREDSSFPTQECERNKVQVRTIRILKEGEGIRHTQTQIASPSNQYPTRQPSKNLIGLSVGVSRSDFSTEVSNTTVTVSRRYTPVLSADFTRMLNEKIGVSAQISTNESIQIGIKYAF